MLERVMGCNSDVSVCVCKLSSSAGPSHKLSLQQCTCRQNIEFDMHHIVIYVHGTAGILFLYQTILAGVVAACNDKSTVALANCATAAPCTGVHT